MKSRPPCASPDFANKLTSANVSLPRDRFWDIPVAKIDSPTRQPMRPGHPASATLGTKRLAQLPQWLYGAYRGLSASGFALAWRTAFVLPRSGHSVS
jgi:hypothetical protein